MYGSQFHFEQVIATKRISTEELSQSFTFEKPEKNTISSILIAILAFAISSIATADTVNPKYHRGFFYYDSER